MAKWSKLQDVDLKLLRVFVIVVESGGFSAAQYALNLSKSTLSEYIKDLEQRLGMTLCQRGPKGFKLYDAGKEVYQAARQLFGSIDTFQNAIIDINKGETGDLTIAMQDGIIHNPAARVHEALSSFSRRYPGIRIIVETMPGHQVLGRVADGLAAIGFAIPSHANDALKFDVLFEEVAGLYCGVGNPLFELPPDRPLREKDLLNYRYCNRGHLEVVAPYWGQHDNLAFRGDIGLGGESQLALILSGRNIGYLARDTAQPYVDRGLLRKLEVEGAASSSPIALVSGSQTHKSKVLGDLTDLLKVAHNIGNELATANEVLHRGTANAALAKPRVRGKGRTHTED